MERVKISDKVQYFPTWDKNSLQKCKRWGPWNLFDLGVFQPSSDHVQGLFTWLPACPSPLHHSRKEGGPDSLSWLLPCTLRAGQWYHLSLFLSLPSCLLLDLLLDDIVLTHSLFLPTEQFLHQLHQQYPSCVMLEKGLLRMVVFGVGGGRGKACSSDSLTTRETRAPWFDTCPALTPHENPSFNSSFKTKFLVFTACEGGLENVSALPWWNHKLDKENFQCPESSGFSVPPCMLSFPGLKEDE